jgi:hypothetical protein
VTGVEVTTLKEIGRKITEVPGRLQGHRTIAASWKTAAR